MTNGCPFRESHREKGQDNSRRNNPPRSAVVYGHGATESSRDSLPGSVGGSVRGQIEEWRRDLEDGLQTETAQIGGRAIRRLLCGPKFHQGFEYKMTSMAGATQ